MNIPAPIVKQVAPQLRQSTCPYCGVGCGVDISCSGSGRALSLDKVSGTPEHPANFGRLCVKGTNLLETNDLSGRLLSPTIAGEEVDWDTATSFVAEKMAQAISEFGPDAVAFYVSGQLLTEDYYIANKFMKGYVGSANIDTNSRLCMSSAVAGYKRAFGEDAVPCSYDDLSCTDLLVITGSNAAWAHPVLFQRMQQAKLRNPEMKIVVIDPRATETTSIADLHIPLKSGSDVALFNGLLNYANDQGAIDKDDVQSFTNNLDQALASASEATLAAVSAICDVDVELLETFYDWFVSSPTAVTFYSMGINQSVAGVDKANAIINCHLALSHIGKPGSGPFSITGQPNAMGGREVGGLANMLAAHRDIENPAHRDSVQRFWKSPVMAQEAGLKAVDLFEAIESGKVKFVWIMGTNPVVSMPNRHQIEAALEKCETVVVSDIVDTNDTLAFANVALPATGWSEKDGTVTNSERCISRQRGMLLPPGQAKHDWQIMCDVACKMGFEEGFTFTTPHQIFDEYAQLTEWENNNEKLLNLSGMVGMSQQEYNRLTPVQWPVKRGEEHLSSKRLFTDRRFSTSNGKANFVAVTYRAPQQQTSAEYPFVLNSGRSRDQWHTMTRTGKAAKLSSHMPYGHLHIHPTDAQMLSITEGQLINITSESSGESGCIYPAKIDSGQRKGDVFIPIHWSKVWGSHCALTRLYAPATDPLSGQPELKHGAVTLAVQEFASYGLLVTSDETTTDVVTQHADYWTKTPMENSEAWRLASNASAPSWLNTLQSVLPESYSFYRFSSAKNSVLVAASDEKFCFAMVVGSDTTTLNPEGRVPTAWLSSLMGQEVSETSVASLLRSEPDEAFLNGPTVCTCFGVRTKTIENAVKTGCSTVDELGQKLKCGTNCGSCKPELQQIIDTQVLRLVESSVQ